MKRSALLAATALIAGVGTSADAALAQDAPPQSQDRASQGNVLDEIVVTGVRRREESVQSVPVAVTALNSDLLERNNVTSMGDLSNLAPNLVIVKQLATPAQASIYLRGFGSESNAPAIDPPVAITVDGIYQPQSSGNMIDLFDVDVIEVQRGPQGTLQGKNAPTGALYVVSKRPTYDFEGQVEVGYERFDHKTVKGRINVPIVPDVLAVKLTGIYKEGGNYIRSLQEGGKRKFGGEDVLAGKIGILFTPSDNFEWLINGFIERGRNPQRGMRDLAYLGADGPFQGTGLTCVRFGHCTETPRFTTNAGWTEDNRSNSKQLSSQMTFRTEPVNITSITGYKHYSEINNSDVDGQPEPLLDALGNPLRYKQFSQEFRINSVENGGLDLGGKLDWVIGAFYSRFSYSNQQALNLYAGDFGPGGAPLFVTLGSDERGKTTSKALFAQFIYNFTDQFNITLGGRQSWDRKTHNYIGVGEAIRFIDDPIKFKNFSMEAGAQYKFTPDKQIYFRYAEGYRAGGFQSLPAPGGTQAPYNPETVKTYEIGFKGDFFDRRLRTNISLFLSKYRDLQRTVIGALDIPPFYSQIVKNAANATVKGVEFEAIIVPTDNLTINTSVTYLDSQYKNYIASFIPGQPATDNDDFPFPYSSKWQVKISPQYRIPMGDNMLTLSGNAVYSSRYFVAGIPYPAARVRPLWNLSARAKFDFADEKYSISIYGENLANNHYIENFTTPPGGNALYFIGQDAKPITYGVSFGAKF